jgi:hypothetical protein
MRKIWKTTIPLIAVLIMTLIFASAPTQAGNIILSNNSGSGNAPFFIEGEQTLVMNGFDLSSQGVQLPMALDAVTISVNTPVPGSNIELVVYQDGNGGSPIDASIIHRQSVSLDSSGSNRIILSEAAVITQPVVWVGFYLPVDFRFNADTSGASVLTYWAWSTGSTFDLNSLASAEILGPGDGSAPVGIDMQGLARITAEMRAPINDEVVTNAPIGQQIVAQESQDTSIMEFYPFCGTLLYDPQDIIISSAFSFTTKCDVADEYNAPTGVVQTSGEVLSMQRAGHLYKIEAYIPEDQRVEGNSHKLPVPVTHCMRIIPGDLERAVIAETRDIPERWYILPTVRFGDLVCAEVTNASYLSYFLPRTESSPPNINLALGWAVVSPHPLQCGKNTTIDVPVVNTGQNWFSTPSGNIKIIVEDVHVRTGIVTAAIEHQIETSRLGPGMRVVINKGDFYVDTYVGELHRLQVRVDFDNLVLETNEFDNTWYTDYILEFPTGKNKCANKPTS